MTETGFSRKTLQGNWYEERFAPVQKVKEQPGFRQIREKDPAISYISKNNMLAPLTSIGRAHHWDTKACVLDAGFREYKTTNKEGFDPKLLTNFTKYEDCRPTQK